jgi:outer membrane protein, heavy metal efflux system
MMSQKRSLLLVSVVVIFSLLAPTIQVAQSGDGGKQAGVQSANSQPALTLEELEKTALAHNPTLGQAAADVRAAEGRMKQASLYPNPVVGYEGREISSGPVIRGGEHGFFIQQSILTAGKRGLSRNVFAQEKVQAQAVADAQGYRVLNAVRLAYYEALGAERRVELRRSLAELTRRALETSKQLFNVGQADQPDVLEADVETQRAELAFLSAQNDQRRVWQQLAAVVGDPSLPLTALDGKLDGELPQLSADDALNRLLSDSPEVKAAEAGIARAERVLARAKVEKYPDIQVGGGLEYNRELLETAGRPVGWEGAAQVSVRIPLFNRNQGNVQAAQAELIHARHELERVRLGQRSNFAFAYRQYVDAFEAARRYRDKMLPHAELAYQLYLKKYGEMAAAYPQVLIAQRTLFQLQEDYVTTLVGLHQSAVEIQGYLLVDGLAAPLPPGEPATVSPGVEVSPIGMP